MGHFVSVAVLNRRPDPNSIPFPDTARHGAASMLVPTTAGVAEAADAVEHRGQSSAANGTATNGTASNGTVANGTVANGKATSGTAATAGRAMADRAAAA